MIFYYFNTVKKTKNMVIDKHHFEHFFFNLIKIIRILFLNYKHKLANSRNELEK